MKQNKKEEEQLSRARAIAHQINSGPGQWIYLANFLHEVKLERSHKRYGFPTFKALRNEGLRLRADKAWQLRTALETVKELDEDGANESLTRGTDYKYGYSVCQKMGAALDELSVAGKDGKAAVKKLKAEFDSGKLTQAYILACRKDAGVIGLQDPVEQVRALEDQIKKLQEKIKRIKASVKPGKRGK